MRNSYVELGYMWFVKNMWFVTICYDSSFLFRVNNFNMTNGSFKRNVWDPFLIISQIIAVQSVFYAGFGLWLVALRFLIHRHMSLRYIFDSSVNNILTIEGRIQLIAFLLNSLTSSLSFRFIVQRAKLCLDFAFTEHFIHFLLCWWIFGFPKFWVWWVMNILGILLVSILSEFLCMRHEIKAIPVVPTGTPS